MFRKLFENPRNRRRNLVLILLPFVLLLGVFGFFAYKSVASIVGSEPTGSSDVYYIESMNYKLRSNATEYQVELFNELNNAIEYGSSDEEIAELVAKNYIADFFTWTNKSGSYDIGGMYYVYSPQKQSIELGARMGFYKYLTYYINTYGSENLLEIKNVEITDIDEFATDYEIIDGVLLPTIDITCEWEYNDYSFDKKTNYVKKAYLTLIMNEDGRVEIAEVYGDE